MSKPWVPDGNPLCFLVTGMAHRRGQVGTEEYIDRMLAHLSGTRHPEDASERYLYDPLSAALQSCMFEPKFIGLKDTSHLKRLLLSCWNGLLDDVKLQAQPILESLKTNGIFYNILGAMICIACSRRDINLLDYCITLVDDLPTLIAMNGSISSAGEQNPDPRIWSTLLDNGWLATPNHQRSISQLANSTLNKGQLGIELLEVLFKHGFVVSDRFFNVAAYMMDSVTMTYLVSKFDASQMNGCNALQAAAGSNPQVLDILLDSGLDVNSMDVKNELIDPREAHTHPFNTALHCAARDGKWDVVKLLLRRGADKDIKDSWGGTAAKRATENGHADIAEFIQAYVS